MPSMSGSPRSRITRPMLVVGGGQRGQAAREPAHGVALAVEHALEPRGDRLVVLDDQDPGTAHARSVGAPARLTCRFDLALTCAQPGADQACLRWRRMTESSVRRGLAAGAVLLALGATACGSSSSGGSSTTAANPNTKESSPPGDIPDNQVYVAFTPPAGRLQRQGPRGLGTALDGRRGHLHRQAQHDPHREPRRVGAALGHARRAAANWPGWRARSRASRPGT